VPQPEASPSAPPTDVAPEAKRSPPPSLGIPAIAALTLGLAPFAPEPHIVGKVKWVLGGAVGMGGADWFDLVMHGAPWLWLAWVAVARLRVSLAR
jgi:hypothetical protein